VFRVNECLDLRARGSQNAEHLGKNRRIWSPRWPLPADSRLIARNLVDVSADRADLGHRPFLLPSSSDQRM